MNTAVAGATGEDQRTICGDFCAALDVFAVSSLYVLAVF